METVKNYVSKMNDAISGARNASVKMFDIFSEAHSKLTTLDFGKFTKEISLEKSTINKMRKICDHKVIRDNAHKLPISWGTLYVLAGMEELVVQELLDSDDLSISSTKKEVVVLKSGNAVAEPAKTGGETDYCGPANCSADADYCEPANAADNEKTSIHLTLKSIIPEINEQKVRNLLGELSEFFVVEGLDEIFPHELKEAA
jgi:hypothetical protein